MAHSLDKLFALLDECMLADRFRLRRQLRDLGRRQRDNGVDDAQLMRLQQDLDKSVALAQARRERVPGVSYPAELPISQRLDDIRELISSNQVVVLCGETGSGKSTQLPKICLELGRGVFGRIAHTQPRRIAARSLASRISSELKRELGDAVGYKIRFHDRVGEATHIKLLTDGMLLAEIQQDKFLNEYDTIILDEAHERSLNIDFLLGYLKNLLPKRPGSEAHHYLRNYRSGALLPAFRRGSHHRGIGPHLSGGGAISAARGRGGQRTGRVHAAGHPGCGG